MSKGVLCHDQENANISLLVLWGMRVAWGWGMEERKRKLERRARPDDGGP